MLAMNIQYTSFEQISHLIKEGELSLRVNRGIALQWSNGGLHCPPEVKMSSGRYFLGLLGVNLCFLSYTIITATWWLLFGIPVIIVGFLLLHPGAKSIIPGFTKYFGWAVTSSIFYSVFGSGPQWLLALSLTILLNGFIIDQLYKMAVSALIQVATNNEYIFVTLWNAGHLGYDTKDGGIFFTSYYIKPDGQSHHYNNVRTQTDKM